MTTTAPRRVLGPFAAASVVVGMVVGAGIFRSASLVAANLQNDTLVLAAWALGVFDMWFGMGAGRAVRFVRGAGLCRIGQRVSASGW